MKKYKILHLPTAQYVYSDIDFGGSGSFWLPDEEAAKNHIAQNKINAVFNSSDVFLALKVILKESSAQYFRTFSHAIIEQFELEVVEVEDNV